MGIRDVLVETRYSPSVQILRWFRSSEIGEEIVESRSRCKYVCGESRRVLVFRLTI